MHPYTVALTGGIASGKSEVARRFAALGASVVDADVVARELVAPGMPALAEIAAAFGSQMLDESGSLERTEMRALVFGDIDARRRLEAIVHPRVRAEMLLRTDAATGPYVLLVIPLLVEKAGYEWTSKFGGERDGAAAVRMWGAGAGLPGVGVAPGAGEEFAGETSRFGALAMRVWSPLIQAEQGGW